MHSVRNKPARRSGYHCSFLTKHSLPRYPPFRLSCFLRASHCPAVRRYPVSAHAVIPQSSMRSTRYIHHPRRRSGSAMLARALTPTQALAGPPLPASSLHTFHFIRHSSIQPVHIPAPPPCSSAALPAACLFSFCLPAGLWSKRGLQVPSLVPHSRPLRAGGTAPTALADAHHPPPLPTALQQRLADRQ